MPGSLPMRPGRIALELLPLTQLLGLGYASPTLRNALPHCGRGQGEGDQRGGAGR
jgi:hypothetical protein